MTPGVHAHSAGTVGSLITNNVYSQIYTKGCVFLKRILTTFWPIIILFCFQSNLDQTQSDCSTHEYYNLTKFGLDWTENK